MAKEITKIVLNESDLKDLIAQKYGLRLDNAKIDIYHYKGDAREPSYTTVTVEGEKLNKS